MVRIDGWPFDLAIAEEYVYESEVTKHPISAGSEIADHVIDGPLRVTLECVVSDTPTGAIAGDPTRQAGDAETPLVSDAAWDKLLEIRAARRAVSIETPRRTLDRMVIVSLVDRRDVATSGGALFTVTFEQITIAENKRVTVRVAVPMVKAKENLGTKQPKPSKLVERRVDAHDGTWFDPDINAWRYVANFDPKTNRWEYTKGTPVGDYPPGLSDEEYRRLIAERRDGALVPVDKKGVPGANAGSFILLPGQF